MWADSQIKGHIKQRPEEPQAQAFLPGRAGGCHPSACEHVPWPKRLSKPIVRGLQRFHCVGFIVSHEPLVFDSVLGPFLFPGGQGVGLKMPIL